MELKEIAVVSGKPGLFKIVKPAKSGVILEALDGSVARFIAGASTKVSVLGEISIYTEGGNNVALEEVFRIMYSKHGKTLPLGPKSTESELREFFVGIVADHDKQRVYNSDIKKVVTWYDLLLKSGFEALFSSKEKVGNEPEEPKKEKRTKKEPVAEENKVSTKPKDITPLQKEAKKESDKKQANTKASTKKAVK